MRASARCGASDTAPVIAEEHWPPRPCPPNPAAIGYHVVLAPARANYVVLAAVGLVRSSTRILPATGLGIVPQT